MINWHDVGAYAWDNKLLIGGYIGLLISSAVRVMPVPGTPFHLYTFIYDWAHQFLNVTNTRLVPFPVTTPPAPPAVEAKAEGAQKETTP